MATGDNPLTAISVARECNIIKSNSLVYLCDLKKINDEERLIWSLIETEQQFLDHKVNESKR